MNTKDHISHSLESNKFPLKNPSEQVLDTLERQQQIACIEHMEKIVSAQADSLIDAYQNLKLLMGAS